MRTLFLSRLLSDTSPKSIDRKGLGESRTGTRQKLNGWFDFTVLSLVLFSRFSDSFSGPSSRMVNQWIKSWFW